MADLYSQEILLKDEKAACSLHRCSVSVQKSANGQLSIQRFIPSLEASYWLEEFEVLSSEYHKWLGKACSVLALEAIQVSLLVVAARVIFKQPENTAN
ncbi:unnamed protein product [Allacma fusca]|uniref:Uncharacterized protein n=1 Tax=Allacma fusca TaxID=39272 RepID=A0A8J2P475_9HEXA|nr:unnamed protein product [Allacma fusca]